MFYQQIREICKFTYLQTCKNTERQIDRKTDKTISDKLGEKKITEEQNGIEWREPDHSYMHIQKT